MAARNSTGARSQPQFPKPPKILEQENYQILQP